MAHALRLRLERRSAGVMLVSILAGSVPVRAAGRPDCQPEIVAERFGAAAPELRVVDASQEAGGVLLVLEEPEDGRRAAVLLWSEMGGVFSAASDARLSPSGAGALAAAPPRTSRDPVVAAALVGCGPPGDVRGAIRAWEGSAARGAGERSVVEPSIVGLLVGVALLALALAAAVLALLRRSTSIAIDPRARWEAVGIVVGVGALAIVVRGGWSYGLGWGLWLLVPLLTGVALVRVAREERRVLGLAALALAAALIVRATASHLPGNWYPDFAGPLWVGLPAHRRPGGMSLAFTALSWIATPGPGLVLASATLASALAVGFMTAAVRVQGRGWPPATAWLFALGLAVEPITVITGASDAAANFALLGFALCLYLYAGALRSGEGPRAPELAMLVGAAALPGLIRPEYAPSSLAVLLLAPPPPSFWRRRALAVLAGTLGAAAAWIGRDVGAEISMPSSERVALWLGGLGDALVGVPAPCRAGLRVPEQTGLLAGLALATVLGQVHAGMVVGRRWRLIAPAVAFVGLAVPRLFSDFYAAPLGCGVAESRYALVSVSLLVLLTAAGAGVVAEAITGVVPRRAAVAAGALVAAASVVLGWVHLDPARARAAAALPYRVEYAYLAEALPALPEAAEVQVHWMESYGGRELDTGLLPGHALLAYLRPDLHWRVLDPTEPARPCPSCWYYRGAVCNLDPEPQGRAGRAELARTLATMREHCGRAIPWSEAGWVGDVTSMVGWPMVDGELRLHLRPLQK